MHRQGHKPSIGCRYLDNTEMGHLAFILEIPTHKRGREQESIFFFSDVVSFYFNYPQLFRLHLTPFIASQLSSGIQSGENIYIYSTTTSPSPCLANIRTFSYSFFKLQMTCHPHFSRGLVWSAWRSSAPWSTGSRTAGSSSTRPRRISMFLKLKTSCFHLLTYIHNSMQS